MNVGGYNLWPLGGGVQGGKNRGVRDNTFYAFTGRMILQTIASATTIGNTAALTPFDQQPTIAKGLLNVVGARATIEMWGHLSTTGTPTLAVIARLDDPTTGDTFAVGGGTSPLVTAVGWAWRFRTGFVVRSIGGTGTLQPFPSSLTLANNTTGVALVNQGLSSTIPAINTNAAHVVYGVIQWGAADPNDTITMDGMSIEIDYPYSTTP